MLDSGGVRVRLVAGSADVRWRLLAGNGRTLGIAAAGAADADGAESALRSVIETRDGLTPSITHPASSVAWTWRALDASGVAVATGDRSYARYGTCQSSYDRFRRTIAALDPDDVADLVRQAMVR